MEQNEIDVSAFKDLQIHLENYNKQRTFGIVLKPQQKTGISNCSIADPKLHSLLITFGRQYVPIPWTTVDVRWTNKSQKLKYQNNYMEGKSYMVGFGSYTEGGIQYNEKSYSIKHRPLVLDGNLKHTIDTFTGNRFFLVYYTIKPSILNTCSLKLDSFEAVYYNGKYVMAWYRDGLAVEYLTKGHPLVEKAKARKKKEVILPMAPINPEMTQAQNLMLWAQKELETSRDV